MNTAAAIGLAQLEKVTWHIERRLEVAAWYRERLREVTQLTYQREKEWAKHAYWMFSVVLGDDIALSRDELIVELQTRGVDTRPVVYPLHVLPPYRHLAEHAAYPVAHRIAQRGLSLPTWAGLTRDDVSYVCDCLMDCLKCSPRMQPA
jgi:perosamine synthetase